MVAVIVSLREIVEELDALPDEATLYLDRETGELYALGDEEAGLVEDGSAEELPDWLRDEVPKIRVVLASERWLSLPTRFDVHEWAIMDEFARSLEDPDLGDELRAAIRGRGAFRMFKDAVSPPRRAAGLVSASVTPRSPTSLRLGSTTTASPTSATWTHREGAGAGQAHRAERQKVCRAAAGRRRLLMRNRLA